jgi:hypothetical protein
MEDALRAVVFRGMKIVGAFMSGFGSQRRFRAVAQTSGVRGKADVLRTSSIGSDWPTAVIGGPVLRYCTTSSKLVGSSERGVTGIHHVRWRGGGVAARGGGGAVQREPSTPFRRSQIPAVIAS